MKIYQWTRPWPTFWLIPWPLVTTYWLIFIWTWSMNYMNFLNITVWPPAAVVRSPSNQRSQPIHPENAATNNSDALRMYENVRDNKVQVDQMSQKNALTALHIDRSTFKRKRLIAEAIIDDPTAFQHTRKQRFITAMLLWSIGKENQPGGPHL